MRKSKLQSKILYQVQFERSKVWGNFVFHALSANLWTETFPSLYEISIQRITSGVATLHYSG